MRRPLERLIAAVAGVSIVLNETDDIPPFDVHLPLLSLPARFRTSIQTIPANVPYLRVAAADRKRAASLVPRTDRCGAALSGRAAANGPITPHATAIRKTSRPFQKSKA